MKASIAHPLSQALCTLTALFALAACGGGGSDSPAPSPAPGGSTPAPSPSPSPSPAPAEGGRAVISYLSACPFQTTTSPKAYLCMTGKYEGRDDFTAQTCTVTIAKDGTVSLNSPGLTDSFSLINGLSSNYTKMAYSDNSIALIWLASGEFNSIHRDSSIKLTINQAQNDNVILEYTKDNANAVTCNISKVTPV